MKIGAKEVLPYCSVRWVYMGCLRKPAGLLAFTKGD